jgi:3-dehydroquinate synthase
MSHPAERPSRIILTGFSGTGKSLAAPIIAERLGWGVLDTDPLIEEQTGKGILDIFRDEGEEAFRDYETEALRSACSRQKVVISTGGGAVLRPENRRLLAGGGFIVCLEARPETILQRLSRRAGEEPLDRPLLAVAGPLPRIRELKEARQHLYALCDWSVHTDELTALQVANEAVRAWETYGPAILGDEGRISAIASPEAAAPSITLHAVPRGACATVRHSLGEYPIFVAWGGLAELGARLADVGISRYAYVITDEAVAHHYEDEIREALRQAGVEFDVYAVPPGEANKNLDTAKEIYDWLIARKAERGHAVIAFGGGMVTDLGGYVAATFARGLPLVQAPTSLLGMVDAAIGGKVAVNHPRAKNMIGAFYQPRFVLADVATLRTLPPRELFAGMAEVIKHGFIADEDYLRRLEEDAGRIRRLEPEATTAAVRGSAAIKARIVTQDEREETGLRMTLNYGHTVGHAIESATGYTKYLHGEAVAIGMTAAAFISERLGLLPAEAAQRQRRLLQRFGLPTHAEGVDRELVKSALALDKKVRSRTVRWVLLNGVGRTVIRDDVPPDLVEEALDEVMR